MKNKRIDKLSIYLIPMITNPFKTNVILQITCLKSISVSYDEDILLKPQYAPHLRFTKIFPT